ncbi:hypothetical protein MKX67_14355 [Cytobacillus sp. FSL W7-1323]|uniref:hypothetical protein n=1 Tax=Cytobacillus TaxID=2675230 RepID=UPI0012FDC286|nr:MULTISPECIES: hypothetical protein [Cytobacillus]MCA1027185.1 hypothetical protein [Cytobacillus kochii]MCM3320853.1 hypothetical protein [Cytobacillus kochii]MCM3344314.1 hypothetical protein [Cytobacillus kochii]MDQ0183998.1 hypothetical protein [Cytobacillus kochii]MEA1852819.1 hypothetical protein [Cytobacillus sp. OWB-43]
MKIILDYDKLLIEDDTYSQLMKGVIHLTALFVVGTIAVYGAVMKYVLNGVTKSEAKS